jgi:hypothetical protein
MQDEPPLAERYFASRYPNEALKFQSPKRALASPSAPRMRALAAFIVKGLGSPEVSTFSWMSR